jgi:hypothetical protein
MGISSELVCLGARLVPFFAKLQTLKPQGEKCKGTIHPLFPNRKTNFWTGWKQAGRWNWSPNGCYHIAFEVSSMTESKISNDSWFRLFAVHLDLRTRRWYEHHCVCLRRSNSRVLRRTMAVRRPDYSTTDHTAENRLDYSVRNVKVNYLGPRYFIVFTK